MYKIFGCPSPLGTSYTDDTLIIDGLLRAYQDGVDVINLSFGDVSGW